ncbi:MAG: FtsX-like permease family protein [Luteitalea sp.]|nr:FtsX-like permease family protein [Luteitalea sp.]
MHAEVSLAAAGREMNDIQAQIERENPDYRDWRASVVPLVDEVLKSTRASVTLLAAAVGFLLLLACANVANLLLARGVGRRRELGVRAALGARQGRLAAQMLTESLVLALLGCAAGILLALLLVRLIVTHGPPTVPGLQETTIDLRVLGFAIVASVLAAVLTGVAPALSAMRARVNAWLTERGAAPAAGGLRVQQALAVGQVALAVAVLVTAGLLIESFRNLSRVDPGFRPEHVVTAKTYLPDTRYSGEAERVAFTDRFLREARALPGLTAVGMGDGVPLGDRRQGGPIWPVDRPRPDELPNANVAWVTDGYFESLRMQVLRGRTFTPDDGPDAPDVMVINRRLARMLFRDDDPIGRRVEAGNPGGVFDIVGVVSDDRNIGIDTEPTPTCFVSLRQRPRFSELAVLARTDGAAEAALSSVRGVVRQLDPELPFFETQTMEQVVSVSLATPRSLAWLLSGFALSGLLLAGIGVFGVLSHAVGQRTQEIGVRVAIGASPGRILTMVLGQGLAQIGAGLVIGFAGAAALSQLLAGLLFGVRSFSTVTYVAVAMLLALISMAACLAPARRAMRIDPATAVRTE